MPTSHRTQMHGVEHSLLPATTSAAYMRIHQLMQQECTSRHHADIYLANYTFCRRLSKPQI